MKTVPCQGPAKVAESQRDERMLGAEASAPDGDRTVELPSRLREVA